MSSNDESPTPAESVVPGRHKKKTWEQLVSEQVKSGKLKGVTCALHSKDTVKNEKQCLCGRLEREHSFVGTPKNISKDVKIWKSSFAKEADVTEYGHLENGARVSSCLIQILYDSFQFIFS